MDCQQNYPFKKQTRLKDCVAVLRQECGLYSDNRVFEHCINQSESRKGRNEFHIFLVSILIGLYCVRLRGCLNTTT